MSDGLRWLWLASVISVDVWDDECWHVLSARHVTLARDAGALSELLLALNSRVIAKLFAGELTDAASLVDEASTVREATGSSVAPCGAMALAAWRGREEQASALIEASMSEAVAYGQGIAVTIGHWASALLFNGLGRYDEAPVAARKVGMIPTELCAANWGLVELVESAACTGATADAAEALEKLSAMTQASGTDWALGVPDLRAYGRARHPVTDPTGSDVLSPGPYAPQVTCVPSRGAVRPGVDAPAGAPQANFTGDAPGLRRARPAPEPDHGGHVTESGPGKRGAGPAAQATVSGDDLHALVQHRRRVEVRLVERGYDRERYDVRRLLPRRRDDRPGSADRPGRYDRSTSGRDGRGGG